MTGLDRCAPNQRVNKASANSRRAGLKAASTGFAKTDMDPVADEAALRHNARETYRMRKETGARQGSARNFELQLQISLVRFDRPRGDDVKKGVSSPTETKEKN